MTLSEAYKDWQKRMPDTRVMVIMKDTHSEPPATVSGPCCSGTHYIDGEPKTDMFVCARERAWRRYVRARDKKPNWMPSLLTALDNKIESRTNFERRNNAN